MIHQVRVIFGDTDQMGIVYYANYFRYFEAARAAYLRHLGKSARDLDDWEVALPVVESHCRHKRPARYEDLLDVDVEVDQLRGASMRFVYEIRLDGDVIADGYTVHACVHPATGVPRRMPVALRALITGDADG